MKAIATVASSDEQPASRYVARTFWWWVLCLVGFFFFRGEERFSGLLMPFLVQRFSLAQLKVPPVAFGIVNCFVDYVE